MIIASLKLKLANFKIPKKCFVVQELPRNTMGKVQKNLLREQHKKLFAWLGIKFLINIRR